MYLIMRFFKYTLKIAYTEPLKKWSYGIFLKGCDIQIFCLRLVKLNDKIANSHNAKQLNWCSC